MFSARGILFDLDGTLVDSVPDIANAANLMLTELGMQTHPDELLAKWVGNGAPRLIKRALTGSVDGEPDSALFERALPLFFDLYAAHIYERSTLYPGVMETLEKFLDQGFKMACVTNKPARHTVSLLQQSNLSQFFSSVVAGDTLALKKPDPAQLIHAAKEFGIETRQCVMVGDSVNDILAAQAARIPVLCLTYGYNQGLDLSASGPDALVDQFVELTDYLSLET